MARSAAHSRRDRPHRSTRLRYCFWILVVIEHPLVDVRPLLDESSGRIQAVDLRFPQARKREFVRGIGSVKERLRKGVDPWVGEGHYVNAANAVRFVSKHQHVEEFDTELKPVFRRLYSDGIVSRLEVGFRTPWLIDSDRFFRFDDAAPTTAIAIETARLAVRVGSEDPIRLLDAGKPFAARMLRATTYTAANRRPKVLEPWWISTGSPLLLCELDLYEVGRVAGYESQLVLAKPRESDRGANVVDRRRSARLVLADRRLAKAFGDGRTTTAHTHLKVARRA